MLNKSVCRAEHINHVCIAVRDLEDSLSFYKDVFGAEPQQDIEEIQDQGVLAALVRVGGSQIEFIQPLESSNGVARFIEKNGESVHHICFEVDNLQDKLDSLDNAGFNLVDKTPREGLSGMIAFIHPKSTKGVLYELVDRDGAKR